MTYDDLGNITSKSDVGIYSYNASGASSVRPHAVAAIVPSGSGTVNTTYTYDANGNMLTGNGRTTSWTSFNMVASITQGTKAVGFDYDGEHARIRQVTNSATTLYINDPASGIRVEKVTGSGGTVQWNEYLFAGGRMIGEHFTNISGTSSTTATRYFVTDHLGSISVITDESGNVVERLSYDAWGKRRFPNGNDDPAGSIASQTTRGFTGHEMIDDIGLVNMNGRIYDPQIGRFMSADPFVSDPTNGQDLNRYAYVNNNPLSYTDPTGYFSLGSLFKIIIAVVIAVVAVVWGGPAIAVATGWGSVTSGAAAGAIGGAISAGLTSGGDLRSILVGAAAGGAFAGLGRAGLAGFEKIMAYGMTGGVTSVMGGGNFQSGFLAAGFSALAGPYIDAVANDNVFAGAAASSVVGGAASVLGGGKFENGAVTGAFTYAVGKFARELNAHEAYNSKFAGPGATIGRRWTTLDFVKHYFLGHGEAVRLVDVGLADDFRNSSSVKAVTGKFIEDTLGRAYPGYTVDGIDTSDVTREPGLFSVGHSSLFMGAGCGISTCTFNFEIKDWFRDSLDLGVEIVGGTPYPINDNWIAIQPYGRQQ